MSIRTLKKIENSQYTRDKVENQYGISLNFGKPLSVNIIHDN